LWATLTWRHSLKIRCIAASYSHTTSHVAMCCCKTFSLSVSFRPDPLSILRLGEFG
jgi:hypothetical protein